MLPEVIDTNLKIVFCGTAAGTTSAKRGQYYAGPGNKFWSTLHEIGLTPVRLYPPDFKKVIEYKLGLTDLVKSKSGMDSTLLKSDFGNVQLIQQIKKYSPGYIAFNGKKAAKEFLKRDVNYGLQNEILNETKFFVLPSTSSAANRCWNIDHWFEIANLIN